MSAIQSSKDVTNNSQSVHDVVETAAEDALPALPEQTENAKAADDASKVASLVDEQNNPTMKLLRSFVTQKNEEPEHFHLPEPRPSTATPTWKCFFVELKPAHPLSGTKTHKCVAKLKNGCMCGAFITVTFTTAKRNFNRRCFKAEKANAHMCASNHRGTEDGAHFEQKKHGNVHREGSISRFISAPSSSKIGTPAECKLTQLEFYLYSPGVHPKATFSCPFFKTMLRTIHGDAAILQQKDILGMVTEEFKLFLVFV
jgi:hypothetical protein